MEFEQTVVIPTRNITSDSPMAEEKSDEEEVPTQESQQQSTPIAVRRQRQDIQKPARFMDMVVYGLSVVDDIPSTYPEAILSSESGNWAGAMEEEMQSLMKNENTWRKSHMQMQLEA